MGLLVRRHVFQRTDQHVAACHHAGDTHPTARKFFRNEAIFECTQSEATIFLRNEDAEIAELGHLVDQLAGHFTLHGIELVGDRPNDVGGEIARGFLDQAAFVGQFRHRVIPQAAAVPGRANVRRRRSGPVR